MMTQLKPTSEFKYEVNNTLLHIEMESGITSDDYDATNVELPNKNNESGLKPKYEVAMEHTFVNICDDKFTIKEELLDVTEQQQTDRAQHQLESTLGCKHYEVKNTDLHIQRELLINKYEDNELKDVEKVTIKSEILDITEQPGEADLQVPKPIIIIKKNEKGTIGDASKAIEISRDEDPAVHKGSEVCEAIKQEWKDFSVPPLIFRSNGLPFTKELRVVLEDVMLTLGKQNTQDFLGGAKKNYVFYLKGQSIKNKIGTHSSNMDMENTNKKVARTNTVNSNTFICDICTKSYQKKSILYQHIQKHFSSYNCTYCSYTVHNKGDLNRHMRTKHTKNNAYNCSYCSYKAYYRSNLFRHVNTKHTKNTAYNCSDCSFIAYAKSSLIRHVKMKHTEDTDYNCSDCSYKAYYRSRLIRHINAKHSKNIVYNCSHCGYKTYVKSNLSRHETIKHVRCTVYNCSGCSYRTYDRSTLSRHRNNKHTENTGYNCSYCSYKTYAIANLKRHVNSKHTKNIVYKCSYCDHKTFIQRNLNSHINAVHTKIDVFNCSHCNYKTFAKNNLRRHIKAKHNN